MSITWLDQVQGPQLADGGPGGVGSAAARTGMLEPVNSSTTWNDAAIDLIGRSSNFVIRNVVGGALGAVGATETAESVRNWADDYDRRFTAEQSPRSQILRSRSLEDTPSGDIPAWLATNAAPSLLPMLATRGRIGLGAGMGALMGGGDAYQNVAGQVGDMGPEQLAAYSERYRSFIAQGMTPEDARLRTMREAGRIAAVPAAVAGAFEGAVESALTGGAARAFRGRGGANPAQSLPTRLFGGTTRGAALEGGVEAFQNTTQELGQQAALLYTQGRDTFSPGNYNRAELQRAAVEGAVLGAAMGGSFGAVGSLRPEQRAALSIQVGGSSSAPPRLLQGPTQPPGGVPGMSGGDAPFQGPDGTFYAPPPGGSAPFVPPSGQPPAPPPPPPSQPAPPAGAPPAGAPPAGAPPAGAPPPAPRATRRSATTPPAPPAPPAARAPAPTVGAKPPLAAPNTPPAPAPDPGLMWNNMAKNLLAVVPDATINIPVNAIRDALNVDRGTARQLHNHLASMTPSAFEALRPAPRPPAVGAAASQAEEQAKAQFAKERAQGVDPLAAAKKTAAQKSPKAAAPAKTEAGGTTTVTQPVAPLVSLKTKAAKTTAQRDATQEKWDNRRQKRKLAAKRAARRATVKDRWLSRRMRKALAAPQPAAAAEAPAKVGAKGQAVLTAAEQRKKRKEMLAAPGERLKGVVATVGLAPEQQAEVNRKNEEARAVNRSDAAERERQRGWGRNVVDENEDTGTKNSLSERADENEERANLREEGVVDPEAAAARMDDPDGPVASNSMGLVELGEIFGKERAAGSARNRIGADLLNEVTNGRMTAQEASDKYGTQPRGVKPWVWEGIKIPDFAAFVRAFMARLPSTDEQAQAIIREATKPGAKTQYLLKLLDPDYKSELQAVVDDLSGKPTQATATQTAPAGAAVKAKFKAKTAALQEGKSGDLTLKSRATASRGNSTPFVEPYKQMSVTEALDLGKKLPGRNAGVFFELLRSGMLRFVPKDVRVIFLPRDAYMDVSGDTESNVSDGLFSAEKKLIFIRADMSPMDIVQTIYHEVTHAATAYGVAQNPALQAELDAMLAYLKTKMDPKTYGLTNKYELLSEAFSNPDFQEELANIPSAGLGRRQSFWQAFIDFILRALDLPSGPGMRSALHDVIFMGTDAMVVNRKAEVAYNAPGARGTRLDIMPKASSTLADRVESTQRWFDGAGKADKAWAMSLGLRRLDQLVRDYATMFKNGGLKAFEIAEARISRAADDFKDRHAKAVEGGVEFLLSPEGRDKLAPLMVRATASQMHPDLAFDAPAHSHIEKNDGNRAIHRVLQQQYNELSPKAKNHYRSVRDYFQEARRDEVDAMLDSVLRTVAPDAKPADLARLRALIGAPRAIETLEKMDDAAVRALGFDNDALASREVLRHLAKVHALRNVPGPYFPLNRFGDYVVSYRNNDFTSEPMTREAAAQFVVSHGGAGLTVEAKGQAFVVRGTLRGTEFFENKSDAEARRDELRRRGYEPSEVESKRRMFALPELDALGLGVLERAVRNTGSKRGLTGSQVDTMIQAMRGFAVQYMPHGRTRMGSELQRENVAGASENMARVMGEHYNNASLRYGFLKEGGARDAAIESMRREVENSQGKRPGEQIKQMALLNELELRIRPGEMTGVEEFARKATKFGFFWALLSPSLPIVNTLQAAMNSQAVLGGRYGQAKAARAILNAQREAGYLTSARKGGGKMLEALSRRLERADFNLFDAVADQMMANTRDKAGTRALLDALKARNLVDHTMQMDLQDLGGGDTSTSKARRALDRVQNFTMMLPQIADVNNRTVIAKAAYDLARQAGKSQQAAVDEAIDQLMRSEPVYNASNKARIFTNKGVFGKLAAPLTQFNQGGQHLYDLLIVAGRDAFTSKDPKIRAEAQRVLTSLVVSHGVFSGVLGILAFQPLSFAIQAMALLAGNTEEPWDYEAAVRRYISTTVGPEMGEIVARGLPRAFGVDLSSRVSLGALNLPELRSYDSKGFSQMLGDFLLAPSGGRASQVIGGMSHLVNGNYLDGFRDISPRAVSDAIKAVQAASGERTDSRGRTEQTPDVGAAGVLLQAFGFRPSEMAERTEMRQSLNKETRQATSERRRILDAWVEADPATRIELRARIAEHNQAYPAFSIRSNNLTRAVDERRRQQREGRQVGGVYVPNNPAVAKWQRERASAYNMGEP